MSPLVPITSCHFVIEQTRTWHKTSWDTNETSPTDTRLNSAKRLWSFEPDVFLYLSRTKFLLFQHERDSIIGDRDILLSSTCARLSYVRFYRISSIRVYIARILELVSEIEKSHVGFRGDFAPRTRGDTFDFTTTECICGFRPRYHVDHSN